MDKKIFKKVCSMDCAPFSQKRLVCKKKGEFKFLQIKTFEETLFKMLGKKNQNKIKKNEINSKKLNILLNKYDNNLIINCTGRCLYKCTKYEKQFEIPKQYGIIINIKNYQAYIENKEKCSTTQFKFRGFIDYYGNVYLTGLISNEIEKDTEIYNFLKSWKSNKIDYGTIRRNDFLLDYVKKIFNHYKLEYTSDFDCSFFRVEIKYNIPSIKKNNNLFVNLSDSAFNGHFFFGQGANSGLNESNQLLNLILGNKDINKEYNAFINIERHGIFKKYNIFHKGRL